MSNTYWSRKFKPNLKPGWKMTESQANHYWRMFGDICRVTQFSGTKADKDEYRKDWHEQSGLGRCSVTTIDHLKGFDALIRTHLAITQPDNVDAQMRMLNMPRTRLVHAINQLAHPDYYLPLLRSSRFKAESLDDLDLTDLEQFRMTLAARVCAAKRSLQTANEPETTPQRRVFQMPAPEPVHAEEPV